MNLLNKLQETTKTHNEAILAFILAFAAGILIKVPALFGIQLDQDESFYIRNLSLFVLPLLTGYFSWKHRIETGTIAKLTLAFVAAGLFANIYPFDQGDDTELLLALHLPIALWLIAGIAFSGGRWSQASSRMNFVRFSGELFIYYVLIALGGGVFPGSWP